MMHLKSFLAIAIAAAVPLCGGESTREREPAAPTVEPEAPATPDSPPKSRDS